jgi:hypothetical protein
MALVLEAEAVGDFLDRKRGRQQQRLGLLDEVLRDAVACRATRDLLHHIGQVFRREAHLGGIPTYAVLLAAMLFHQGEEAPRQLLGTREGVEAAERTVVEPVDVIDQRTHQVEHHVMGVANLGRLHHLAHQGEIMHRHLHLLLRHREDGAHIGVDMAVQRHPQVEFLGKLRRKTQHVFHHVVARLRHAEHLVDQDGRETRGGNLI